MGVYADLSQDEYRSKALGYNADLHEERPLRAAPFLYEGTVPPKEVDWVAKGAVTPVRGQKGISRGCVGPAGIFIYTGCSPVPLSVHCISPGGPDGPRAHGNIYLPRYLPASLHVCCCVSR